MKQLGPEGDRAIEQVLGYLNFSSGASDPQTLANIDLLFQHFANGDGEEAAWRVVGHALRDRLRVLAAESAAFGNSDQAESVLSAVVDELLPSYLEFHGDLLFHQSPAVLVNSFFFGRACEAVLRLGSDWSNPVQIAQQAIAQLNDFVGHRPVATLQTHKMEPYAHERVRPVPLYIRDAGAACGHYRQVVEQALELLAQSDDDILRAAHFDPQLLDELAFDPRAYDFDHPVNKRPNYHFGQWDPHVIDNQGRYRRFVVQQVTLDALMARLSDAPGIEPHELQFEAAAVLAGTILMGAGVSGAGPDAHDSSVTLATLLPVIARYRDGFYERLFSRTNGEHAERLRAEAQEKRQPFGGARQHLNAQLARRRAAQMEHVQLAKIYAQMGYSEAAAKQADIVPAASARIVCRIDCRLTEGHHAADRGDIARTVELLDEILDLLRRGIECGAIIDPWSILGFDAHFSLFPALENSIHDHRADELAALMEQIFALYSRAWSDAAARDQQQLCQRISDDFRRTADWWRKFAAHEVDAIEAPDGLQAFEAARRVAQALSVWHQGGAAAGDVAFWASHAEMFDSPEAYALVIDALLQRGDFVTSMALLVHWLGQAGQIPLQQGDSSFHRLVDQWLTALRDRSVDDASRADNWRLARKFFDHLEANAGEFWSIPAFQLGPQSDPKGEQQAAAGGSSPQGEAEEEPYDDENDGLFSAAYEDMVFRDSADDGIESELFDNEPTTDSELSQEARRVGDRLDLLETVARFWQVAAAFRCLSPAGQTGPHKQTEQAECNDRSTALQDWVDQAAANFQQLMELLDQVRDYRLSPSGGDHDSMVEYDRKRLTKESLLEAIMNVCVETADAQRLLLAAMAGEAGQAEEPWRNTAPGLSSDEQRAIEILGAVLQGDSQQVRRCWPDLIAALRQQPLLYVPLAKGGAPRDIVAARVRQRSIQDLLVSLPRLGLLTETCQLIEAAREMESANPVGPGAVTEFDDLFSIGARSVVEQIVQSGGGWTALVAAGDEEAPVDAPLVACLEQLTESLLHSWLKHSRTLRLSVLEKVSDSRSWKKLVEFIETYGQDLFTQRFLNLSNVRAILHQGVAAWLARLKDEADDDEAPLVVRALDSQISIEEAAAQLSLILEAIIENYSEYRDYNSTTTQSDRGEMLYTLLDFLRLRVKYDRISWNLRPVVLAHEILVRSGHADAARLWRRALTERIGDEAEGYVRKVAQLQRKYAMQMPSVADRVAERFVRPMEVDRIRALVKPAIEEAKSSGPCRAFQALERKADALTSEPSGAGLDMPYWLVSLEDEVERLKRPGNHCDDRSDLKSVIPAINLTYDEVKQQIDELEAWSADDE